MKRLFPWMLMVLALVGTACGSDDDGPKETTPNPLGEMFSRSSALLGCSCVFVMEMPDEYCRGYVLTPISIERSSTTVRSGTGAEEMIGTFVDMRQGCTVTRAE